MDKIPNLGFEAALSHFYSSTAALRKASGALVVTTLLYAYLVPQVLSITNDAVEAEAALDHAMELRRLGDRLAAKRGDDAVTLGALSQFARSDEERRLGRDAESFLERLSASYYEILGPDEIAFLAERIVPIDTLETSDLRQHLTVGRVARLARFLAAVREREGRSLAEKGTFTIPLLGLELGFTFTSALCAPLLAVLALIQATIVRRRKWLKENLIESWKVPEDDPRINDFSLDHSEGYTQKAPGADVSLAFSGLRAFLRFGPLVVACVYAQAFFWTPEQALAPIWSMTDRFASSVDLFFPLLVGPLLMFSLLLLLLTAINPTLAPGGSTRREGLSRRAFSLLAVATAAFPIIAIVAGALGSRSPLTYALWDSTAFVAGTVWQLAFLVLYRRGVMLAAFAFGLCAASYHGFLLSQLVEVILESRTFDSAIRLLMAIFNLGTVLVFLTRRIRTSLEAALRRAS